jgi:hypothetical protein
MALSKRLRFEILRRDEHTCRYCGGRAPDVRLTVDHVVPVALGGDDEPTNLVTACTDCNSGKAASSPDAAQVAAVDDKALQWAAALRLAAENALGRREARDRDRQRFADAWREWTIGNATVPLPIDWAPTVDRLIASGLTVDDLVDAVDIAMRTPTVQDVFRYVCGVALAEIRRRQDEALTYVSAVA